jgi:asparagine synthase (glutamine-hydrolysing)
MLQTMVHWQPDNVGVFMGTQHTRVLRTNPVLKEEAIVNEGIRLNEATLAQLLAGAPQTHIALGNCLLWNTPESLSEFLPDFDRHTGLAITADARIDNRDELTDLLNIDQEIAKHLSDSAFILKAYQKWGDDCAKHLLGDFAFAIFDANTNNLFLVRDQFGVRPLFYYDSDDYFVFSSELRAFDKKTFKQTIDEQWLIDLVAEIYPEPWKTSRKEIRRVQPAHCLKIANNQCVEEKYFDFSLENIEVSNENEVYAEVDRLVRQALTCRMRSIYPVGSEMSSGYDSSIIAIIGHQIKTPEQAFLQFSHVMPQWSEFKHVPRLDEQQGIEEICRFAGIPLPFWITAENKSINQAIEDAFDAMGELSTCRFPVYSDVLIEEAEKQHCRTMLSGYGGDEGLSTFAPGYFCELAYHNQWAKYFVQLYKHCQYRKTPFLKRSVREIVTAKSVKFEKYLTVRHFKRKDLKSAKCQLFTKRIKESQEFINRAIERSPAQHSPIVNIRQYNRLRHSYIYHRYEESNLISLRHKMVYSYPFADVRLVQYVLSLPAQYKYSLIGRPLVRNTFGQYMHPSHRNRLKEGYTISNLLARKAEVLNWNEKLIPEAFANLQWFDFEKLANSFEGKSDLSDQNEVTDLKKNIYKVLSIINLQKF